MNHLDPPPDDLSPNFRRLREQIEEANEVLGSRDAKRAHELAEQMISTMVDIGLDDFELSPDLIAEVNRRLRSGRPPTPGDG